MGPCSHEKCTGASAFFRLACARRRWQKHRSRGTVRASSGSYHCWPRSQSPSCGITDGISSSSYDTTSGMSSSWGITKPPTRSPPQRHPARRGAPRRAPPAPTPNPAGGDGHGAQATSPPARSQSTRGWRSPGRPTPPAPPRSRHPPGERHSDGVAKLPERAAHRRERDPQLVPLAAQLLQLGVQLVETLGVLVLAGVRARDDRKERLQLLDARPSVVQVHLEVGDRFLHRGDGVLVVFLVHVLERRVAQVREGVLQLHHSPSPLSATCSAFTLRSRRTSSPSSSIASASRSAEVRQSFTASTSSMSVPTPSSHPTASRRTTRRSRSSVRSRSTSALGATAVTLRHTGQVSYCRGGQSQTSVRMSAS